MDYGETPRSMAYPEAYAERLERIHDSTIAPLTRYVEALRRLSGKADGVPYMDPLDGGIQAQVLLLLEAPGGKAAAGDGGTGSGFVSRNNNDATAARIFSSGKDAGLQREQTLMWNIVPWYVGSDGVIRAVTAQEVERGRQHLRAAHAPAPASGGRDFRSARRPGLGTTAGQLPRADHVDHLAPKVAGPGGHAGSRTADH